MRLLVCLASLIFASSVIAVPPPSYDDAPLRSVQFIDDREGWAAGDDGVIWHSIDSGKTWERQKTGSRAALQSLHMLTPYSGWAVGRREQPDDLGSIGVILMTTDGGITWTETTVGLLPGLNGVRFFDEKNGLVMGDATAAYPSGVFATTDGGASWRPLTGSGSPTWLAAATPKLDGTILAGAWGQLARISGGTLTPFGPAIPGSRAVRTVQRLGESTLIGGEGGLLLLGTNEQWKAIELPFPAEARSVCDFQCSTTVGPKIWLAGRLGANILFSPDSGQSWQLQKTPVAVPMLSIAMLNESLGWAVGELGTILATTDGGKTWTHRKGSGPKVALLTINAHAKDVPVALFPGVGAKEGYFIASVRLTSADPLTADPRRACDPMKMVSAVRSAGGSVGESLWAFPLPHHCDGLPADALRSYWDSLHDGRAAEQLLRQLTYAIRVWRPDVIVTDSIAPNASAAEQLTLAAVQEAFKRAADPNAFPEQLTALGLSEHAAGKLYGTTETLTDANVYLDPMAFVPEVAESADSMTFAAKQLLGSRTTTLFRLVAHRVKDADKHTQIMDGVTLARGGLARKPDPQTTWRFTDEYVNGRADVSQVRTTILKEFDKPFTAESRKAIEERLPVLPMNDAMETVLTLANAAQTRGQWTTAREWYSLATDRYPAHPLTPSAYRWQMKFHGSSEVQRRLELGQMPFVRPAEFYELPANLIQQVSVKDSLGSPLKARFRSTDAEREWVTTGLLQEPKLFAIQPLLSQDPSTQLMMNATRLRLGLTADAEKTMASYARRSVAGSPQFQAITQEVALTARQPVKPMTVCEKFATRPTLDGKLTEDVWANRTPFAHGSATPSGYATEAKFGYDDEFLYIGVTCQHPVGEQVPLADMRRYDDDLTPFDRVEILLDSDRDYATYHRLRVDQRGCTADDSCGDHTWNPQWFVAVTNSATGWTAEIAIPLSELTGRPPSAKHVWAANVVRVLPGRGIRAMNGPADAVPRLEGLGLLEFRANTMVQHATDR